MTSKKKAPALRKASETGKCLTCPNGKEPGRNLCVACDTDFAASPERAEQERLRATGEDVAIECEELGRAWWQRRLAVTSTISEAA